MTEMVKATGQRLSVESEGLPEQKLIHTGRKVNLSVLTGRAQPLSNVGLTAKAPGPNLSRINLSLKQQSTDKNNVGKQSFSGQGSAWINLLQYPLIHYRKTVRQYSLEAMIRLVF